MLQQNYKYFQDRVAEYQISNLRDDEKFILDRHFTDHGASMLILGCGAGRTLIPISDYGYKLTAIDYVPEMVAAAIKHIKNININIHQMDATDLSFDDAGFKYVFFPFHGIDCIYPDIYASVKEAARVLTDDGKLIFCSHNRWFIKRWRTIFKKYFPYNGALLYQASILDYFKLKKYFKRVDFKFRISMLKSEHANWKDRIYKLLPFLSISIYFICTKPKK